MNKVQALYLEELAKSLFEDLDALPHIIRLEGEVSQSTYMFKNTDAPMRS